MQKIKLNKKKKISQSINSNLNIGCSKKFKTIKILGGFKKRYAYVGNVIVCYIQGIRYNKKKKIVSIKLRPIKLRYLKLRYLNKRKIYLFINYKNSYYTENNNWDDDWNDDDYTSKPIKPVSYISKPIKPYISNPIKPIVNKTPMGSNKMGENKYSLSKYLMKKFFKSNNPLFKDILLSILEIINPLELRMYVFYNKNRIIFLRTKKNWIEVFNLTVEFIMYKRMFHNEKRIMLDRIRTKKNLIHLFNLIKDYIKDLIKKIKRYFF